MRRSRNQAGALGALPPTVLGMPTKLVLFGVAGAVALAVLNAGPAEAAPTGQAADGSTPASSGGTTKPTTSGSTVPSTTTGATKKKRPAIVQALKTSRYVFVNSIAGEGIFDRLRLEFSILHAIDGYGIDRIHTLGNGEFVGYATGKEYTAPDSGRTYIQLWYSINGKQYNYWIEKSQVKIMSNAEVDAAKAAGYQWSGTSLWSIANMSAETKADITRFYLTHYL